MSKKKLKTIREKLLSIPDYGELAVEEHIRQYEDKERYCDMLPIDSETELSVKQILRLRHVSFEWQFSLLEYDFWEAVYESLPDE